MSSATLVPDALKKTVVVHYVNAVLAALGGLIYMIFGFAALGEEGAAGFGIFAIIAGILVIALGLALNILAARGLKRLSNGWRVYSIVVSILGIASIPFGTILSILALTGLFNEETKKAFEAAKK